MAAEKLFLESESTFEKLSAETALPDDPNQWSNEIMQELYKQIPYVHDFDVSVKMNKVEAEKGFGFGHAEISNKTEAPRGTPQQQLENAGVRVARVPIIIKEGKLQPFDVLLTEDTKMLPLTESRLRQSLFRPQQFDVTSKTPGDTSMIGQLYPPYRQNSGFGGGGTSSDAGMMGKAGSAGEAGGMEKRAFLGFLRDKKPEPLLADTEEEANRLAHQYPGRDVILVSEKTGSAPQDWDLELEPPATSELEEYVMKEASVSGTAKTVASGAKTVAEGVKTMVSQGAPKAKGATDAAKGWVKKHPLATAGIAAGTAAAGTAAAMSGGKKKEPEKTVTASILQAVLPVANESDVDSFKRSLLDENTKLAYVENSATHDSITAIDSAEPTPMGKTAAALASHIRPNVLQVRKLPDGYAIKTASVHAWCPVEETVDRGEAVRRCGLEVVKTADEDTGAVTVSDAEGVPEEEEAPPETTSITDAGTYMVETDAGEKLQGTVITNLIDLDGRPIPISLFTDGERSAVQADIAGTRVGDQVPVQGVPASEASGVGVFYAEVGGVPAATVPLSLGASYQEGEEEPPTMEAQAFDGRPCRVSVQPQLQSVAVLDDKLLIPDTWQWLPLGETEDVALKGGPDQVGAEVEALKAAAAVHIRASDPDCFYFSGIPVEKLAAAERHEVDQAGALFLLAGLGVDLETSKKKLAEASTGFRPVQMRVGRFMKTSEEAWNSAHRASQEYFNSNPQIRVQLWKEASVIPDPVAVDTVLSLGFINPENVNTFIGYLPTLDEAQSKLCELLIGSRLGIKEVPQGALEKSIRALEEVITGLKVIAFQG